MNKNLYKKLARNNIKKNKSTYFPYIFSTIVTISLFFILYTITEEVSNGGFYGDSTMGTILNFGVYTVGIFSIIFIFYTNNFLLKRRKKELGLYSVLGMEKRHISKVLFYEVIYSGGFSLIFGILFGTLFSKLMFAFLLNILNLDTSIGLNISIKSVGVTSVLFFVIFALEILFNIINIKRINPIDLISGGKKGEREPKSNWFIGLLGIISLGMGYYIALIIENPISAINMFFIAVILVSIGTYFIFTSGSIIIIKLLRKNKNFYYKKNHFISVSNMIYRMKQNAVGLANIAILSTAVLLVLSTTISLYVGMEDIMSDRYTEDVITNYVYEGQNLEEIESIILKHAETKDIKIKDPLKYYNSGFVGHLEDNNLVGKDILNKKSFEDIYGVGIFTLDDYNRIHGTNLELDNEEVLINSNTSDFNYEDIMLYGKKYSIKEQVDSMKFKMNPVFNGVNIVVADMEEMNSLISMINEMDSRDGEYHIYYDYHFDIEGEFENKISFGSTLRETLNASIERVGTVDDRYTSRQGFLSIYGSLFFIGIFLGTLFMVATVLIIYYKQISEGYEDRERFNILQKVGMSKSEVKNTIRSQTLIVFFLPLVTAIIHIMVAFPLVSKILAILNLNNTKLFLICTGIVILVFGIAYGIVYRWTAKVYYKIVN